MAIDLNSLNFQYRSTAGSDGGRKNSYSFTYSDPNGQSYTFVPDSVINQGVKGTGDNQFVFPWFLNKENLATLGKNSQKVDFSNTADGSYYKDDVGSSTTGFLFPTGAIPFDGEVRTFPKSQGDITGISENNGQLVYVQKPVGGEDSRYLTPDGTIHSVTQGRSWLGDTFGGLGDAAADFINSDIGKLAITAGALYAGGAFDPSSAAATGGEIAGSGAAATNASTLAADYYGLPAGSAYVAPEVTTLGNVAGSTEGMLAAPEIAGMGGAQGLTMPAGTNLAEMGGGQGLLSGAGTGLAEMGGAQGLTTAGAAGGLLGAAGLTGGASTPLAAGIGTGIGTSLAGLDTGATAAGLTGAAAGNAAGAGTLTGSTLGDMAAINAGASLIGGTLQSNAAKEAAQIQADAAAKAIAQQQKNFETINAQQAPYRAAGYNALNDIANLTTGQTPQYDANGNVVKDANGNPVMATGSGYLQHQFDATDLAKGLAPNYDFMLGQGQMANQRAANMGGGAIGGNALQGLNKYTQDYAGNAYQNAFTNYQNQRSNIYNTLASIAGIGQTGQNATNTAATNATNATTQLGVGSAGAQAAGTVGSANAYNNAINNATNNYTLASLLNQRGNVQMPIG